MSYGLLFHNILAAESGTYGEDTSIHNHSCKLANGGRYWLQYQSPIIQKARQKSDDYNKIANPKVMAQTSSSFEMKTIAVIVGDVTNLIVQLVCISLWQLLYSIYLAYAHSVD